MRSLTNDDDRTMQLAGFLQDAPIIICTYLFVSEGDAANRTPKNWRRRKIGRCRSLICCKYCP